MNTFDPTSSLYRFGIRFVICLSLGSIAYAQTQKRQITLEWIFGPEGRSVASLPSTAWLDDGTLIILDNRRPVNERTFEKLDPSSGKRQSIVDAARAMADLRSVDKDMPASLTWPIAFDGAARQALYLFNGDVFVLEFSNSRFRRVTSPGLRRRCARCSTIRMRPSGWPSPPASD